MGIAVESGTTIRFEHEAFIDSSRFGKDLAPNPVVTPGPVIYRAKSVLDTAMVFPGIFGAPSVDGKGRITVQTFDFTSFRVELNWAWDPDVTLVTDLDRVITDLAFGAGEAEVRRGTDGYWWNGTTWQSTVYALATIAAGDVTDPYHYFDFTLPATGQWFSVKMRANADPVLEKQIMISQLVSITGGGGSTAFFID